MKIRTCFVSNSSSSSFIAVGVWETTSTFKSLSVALNLVDSDVPWWEHLPRSGYPSKGEYGQYQAGDLTLYCGEEGVFFIGVDALNMLKRDKKVSDVTRVFEEACGNLHVNPEPNEVKLEIGESGAG